jgi:hypothetical protein
MPDNIGDITLQRFVHVLVEVGIELVVAVAAVAAVVVVRAEVLEDEHVL